MMLLLCLILITLLLSFLLFLFLFWPALRIRSNLQSSIAYEEPVPLTWHREIFNSRLSQQPPLLSIIIPAYNEESRFPKMLHSTLNYLTDEKTHDDVVSLCMDVLRIPPEQQQMHREKKYVSFEIIVVDDGSTDRTIEIVQEFLGKRRNKTDDVLVRLLTMARNCGKGGAVREGVLESKGLLVLMVDADGATNFETGLPKLLKRMGGDGSSRSGSSSDGDGGASSSGEGNNQQRTVPAVFGSRAHLQQQSLATRTLIRTILMRSFHFFVWILCCQTHIRDTQCGFKLFTKSTARLLFRNLHLSRWAFDTELVVIAQRLGLGIEEVGVEWSEVEGSKLEDGGKVGLALTSLGMLRDMFCVRICYGLGFWILKKDDGVRRKKCD